MKKEWLTINEASKLTGKHADTIRKFFKEHESESKRDESRKNAYILPKSLILAHFEVKEIEVEDKSEEDEKLLSYVQKENEYLRKRISELESTITRIAEMNTQNELARRQIELEQIKNENLRLNSQNPTIESAELTEVEHNEDKRDLTSMKESTTYKKEEGNIILSEPQKKKWSIFKRKEK